MKIKKLSCDQFAGINGKDITLNDGVTVICGPNETGKSTLADLVGAMFFKDTKVRKNGTFFDQYFPKKKGTAGDCIDGRIEFETPSGKYVLTKEWMMPEGTCKMILPEGTVVRDPATIGEILKKELGFGEALYRNLIFPSQRVPSEFLKAVFASGDEDSETKDQLLATMASAAVETGGIDPAKVEKRLTEILHDYDEHFDVAADMPEGGRKRGLGNKWACATSEKSVRENTAILLRAWYAMKAAEEELTGAKDMDAALGRMSSQMEDDRKARKDLMDRKERFMSAVGNLERHARLESEKRQLEEKLNELKRDSKEWPELTNRMNTIHGLIEEYKDSDYSDDLREFQIAMGEIPGIREQLKKIPKTLDDDLNAVCSCEDKIREAMTRLGAMSLRAKFDLADGQTVTVTPLSGGEEQKVSGDFVIKEAVRISVPGVMSMELFPDGINACEEERKLSEAKAEIRRISDLYGEDVTSGSLSRLKEEEQKLLHVLGENEDITDEILKRYPDREIEEMMEEKVCECRAVEDIVTDLKFACDCTSQMPSEIMSHARAALLVCENRVNELIGKYSDISDPDHILGYIDEVAKAAGMAAITDAMSDIEKKMESCESELAKIGEIPEEFVSVEDPERFKQDLTDRIDNLTDAIDSVGRDMAAKDAKLEEHPLSDCEEALSEATKAYEEAKADYFRWKRISETFAKENGTSDDAPGADVLKRFTGYLAKIGGDRLQADDAVLFHVNVTTGTNRVPYELLSEGTKETAALAFRLAVLDHLFPDGGGFAIFDDPCTDMDPERTKAACDLIRAFAEKNQVLFLTCDPKYNDMFS